MTQAKSDRRAPKRAARSETRTQTTSPTVSVEAAPAPALEEQPSIEAYVKAFRSVVTPERLRAMAVDLIADFNEQETPLKDKFAIWSRFAAYAIGTPTRQAETSDHSRAEEFFKALLDGREIDAPTRD